MFISNDKVTGIFVLTDEFCIEFNKSVQSNTIGNKSKRKPKMSQSEIITIMILFHYGAFKNLKHFYLNYIKVHMKSDFPNTCHTIGLLNYNNHQF